MSMYTTLDGAREELSKRWRDIELKKRIEVELADKFLPLFKKNARAVLFRVLCSPDNGFTFFLQCAKYINADPLILEYLNDIFVHFNDEKKGLGRLRVELEDGGKAHVDVMDFYKNEKNKLDMISLKTGENLVDFHHNLFKIFKYRVDLHDNSDWFKIIGRASDYYYYLLLHFVAHGVLIETFLNEGDKHEDAFTNEIIIPAINKIKDKFKLDPLIIRLYPEHQNRLEDFYWWCYPPNINEYIINFAKKNNLPLKMLNL